LDHPNFKYNDAQKRRLLDKWHIHPATIIIGFYKHLSNKIRKATKEHKNQCNQFIFLKLDTISKYRTDVWKTVKDELSKRSYPNVIDLGLYCLPSYDPTLKVKLFNEYFTSISTVPDDVLSKSLPNFQFYTDCAFPQAFTPLNYEVLLKIVLFGHPDFLSHPSRAGLRGGGQRGAIAPGPRLQGGPGDDNLLF